MREVLLAALVERFGDRGLRVGAPPETDAVIPGKHPEVGDVVLRIDSTACIIQIGDIIGETFTDYDFDRDPAERADRITKEVVRFLDELLKDRLLFWRATDGRNAAWRERGDAGHAEPLVLDNRTYRRYISSGPLGPWQGAPAILQRGQIRDDRDYEILSAFLRDTEVGSAEESPRQLASRLVADYDAKLEADS